MNFGFCLLLGSIIHSFYYGGYMLGYMDGVPVFLQFLIVILQSAPEVVVEDQDASRAFALSSFHMTSEFVQSGTRNVERTGAGLCFDEP